MEIRRTLGPSREQLAEILHYSVRTIERHERGHGPILETLSSMAHKFNLNISLSIEGIQQRPFAVAVSNPNASTGCTTLCICLAGFLAKLGKRVRVLFGPGQTDFHEILKQRSDKFPTIDSTALSDFKELPVAMRVGGSYDVILVDCPRIDYGYSEENWERSNIAFLETVRDSVDLVLVPLRYNYPILKHACHPCFYRDFTRLFLRDPGPRLLLIMNKFISRMKVIAATNGGLSARHLRQM